MYCAMARCLKMSSGVSCRRIWPDTRLKSAPGLWIPLRSSSCRVYQYVLRDGPLPEDVIRGVLLCSHFNVEFDELLLADLPIAHAEPTAARICLLEYIGHELFYSGVLRVLVQLPEFRHVELSGPIVVCRGEEYCHHGLAVSTCGVRIKRKPRHKPRVHASTHGALAMRADGHERPGRA